MSAGNHTKLAALLRAMESFRNLGRATQGDVAALAELHPNTVSKYTQVLHSRGWIRPVGTIDTGRRGGPSLVWEWQAR